jgi:hypothetical protein
MSGNIKSRAGVLTRMKNISRVITEAVPATMAEDAPDDAVTISAEEVKDVETKIVAMGSSNISIPVGIEVKKFVPDSTKAVLNIDELEIYTKEVHEWVKAHPDWDSKEDIDDINGIAMEKVIQYRLLTKQKRKPHLDIEKNYNSSVSRVQVCRTNLAARRVDRISGKSKTIHQTNIALIAGRMDDNEMKILRHRNNKEEEEEIRFFPPPEQ